jgi:hypothetical protein
MGTGDNAVDSRLAGELSDAVRELIEDFVEVCLPVDTRPLLLMRDKATGSVFLEVHISASRLVPVATVDVPLDPDEQGEYRANREVVEDHVAFAKMKEDAKNLRTFSNIVCEFTRTFDEEFPLKIIGGQHRFTAIKDALDSGIDEHHGLKVYFALDPEQRLDVQLISNTNIDVSSDLFDRMTETLAGPQLRTWCQEVGLLETGEDFADRRARGNPITVREARTFIINYIHGTKVDSKKFDRTGTTPSLVKSGAQIEDWDTLKAENPDLWENENLKLAGREFAELIKVQRARSGSGANASKAAVRRDFADKALNFAVLSAWAYVAGVLHDNRTRQKRHFDLRKKPSGDPLNAPALAKGRHKTDPENYRGLGYRTDAKERGRMAELFFLQAENGSQITRANVDLAVKKYHAKEAQLEVSRAEEKAKSQ